MAELEEKMNALQSYTRELQFYEETHNHLQQERDDLYEKNAKNLKKIE